MPKTKEKIIAEARAYAAEASRGRLADWLESCNLDVQQAPRFVSPFGDDE